MKKFGFIVSNAVSSMLSKKLLTLIIIVTVAVGFIIPSVFIAKTAYHIKTYKASLYTDIEKTALADITMKYKTKDEMSTVFGGIKDVDDIGYFTSKAKSVSCGEKSFQALVLGVSEHFYKLRRPIIMDGRVITEQEIESGAKVCMAVAYRTMSGYSPKVGDAINIGAEDYEVVGIIHDPTVYGSIIIPYTCFEKLINADVRPQLQYVIYLHSDSAEAAEVLANRVKGMQDINVINAGYAVVKDKEWRAEITKPMKSTLMLSSVLMAFSMINFVIIFYGKFLEDRYRISLKLLLGESRRGIFAEILTQTFIFFQLAFIIDGITVKLLIPHIDSLLMVVDKNYILISEGVCILFSVVISVIVTAVSLKRNTAASIKEE